MTYVSDTCKSSHILANQNEISNLSWSPSQVTNMFQSPSCKIVPRAKSVTIVDIRTVLSLQIIFLPHLFTVTTLKIDRKSRRCLGLRFTHQQRLPGCGRDIPDWTVFISECTQRLFCEKASMLITDTSKHEEKTNNLRKAWIISAFLF